MPSVQTQDLQLDTEYEPVVILVQDFSVNI